MYWGGEIDQRGSDWILEKGGEESDGGFFEQYIMKCDSKRA